MSISKESIRYIILTNKTEESEIIIPNYKESLCQPPWRHSYIIYIEINNHIIKAEYQYGGHPIPVAHKKKTCVTLPCGVLSEDVFDANIKIDKENNQKYLQTAYDFYKIWEEDPSENNNNVVAEAESWTSPSEYCNIM